MTYILLILLVGVIIYIITQKKKSPETDDKKEKQPLPIAGAYEREWLFTYNEKAAYEKLKPIADKLGYILLAKVRMLDLVKPSSGNPKYKTYFYKVQAKHVDFVLCDPKLVARCIIELDDSSHNAKDRKERDHFVDEVLESVGYKVIHTYGINEETEKEIKEKLGK